VRHDEKKPERGARPVRRGAPSGEAGKAGEGRPRSERDANRGQNPRGERRGKPEFARKREDGEAPRPEGKRDGHKKPQHQNKPREERPAKFDPDSPFAKLAALRDQLKK
jgi:ATP-dependent RNA helicase SUPV3L1/SUV3